MIHLPGSYPNHSVTYRVKRKYGLLENVFNYYYRMQALLLQITFRFQVLFMRLPSWSGKFWLKVKRPMKKEMRKKYIFFIINQYQRQCTNLLVRGYYR